jgi:hypothetical protein
MMEYKVPTTDTTVATASPPRKVSHATIKSPVKSTPPWKDLTSPFGGIVTQLTITMQPALPTRISTMAPTWDAACYSDDSDTPAIVLIRQVTTMIFDLTAAKTNP